MCSEFRCASCAFAVLTGIMPGGVSEYACCKESHSVPYFYYDSNPDRVADCANYLSNKHITSSRMDRPVTIFKESQS